MKTSNSSTDRYHVSKNVKGGWMDGWVAGWLRSYGNGTNDLTVTQYVKLCGIIFSTFTILQEIFGVISWQL